MVRRKPSPHSKLALFSVTGGHMPFQTAATLRPLALIVDDDADTREMYSIHLSLHGIGVVEAHGGEEAIQIANTLLPDVITTDLGLGDFADTILCKRLKDCHATKGIPVIAVTGRGMPHEVTAALSAGCVSVLLKPCLPETLLTEIRRVWNASQTASITEQAF